MADREPVANKTTHSGDIDENDTQDIMTNPVDQILGNNSYHVVTGSGTDRTAKLDGFVITAGYARTASATYSGGGIYNQKGSPELINLVIMGNRANYGGGISNEDNSSPLLLNVVISNNVGDARGGGVYVFNNSYPELTNVTITENSAAYGGGVYSRYASAPVITNSIIWNNAEAGSKEVPGASIFNFSTSDLVAIVSHSLVANSGGSGDWNELIGTDGGSNIDDDPLFTN